MILLLFVLNVAISAWNAYASGAYWTESKLIGGTVRLLTWCGLVMSACGFTWCYLLVVAMGAELAGYLTPAETDLAIKAGYLVLILPILGSGLAIWAESVASAWRERSLGSIARAAWNTHAQASNTWSAVRDAPGIFSGVWEALAGGDTDDDSPGPAVALVLFAVVLALVGGVLTTAAIARWADRRVALEVR